ncbi:AMP-binding protein [Photorhabdus akhurstii]|uniref:AMP-binding protein n=1 Tax=Photorhabdus akhurstii TaxID=171438 RepID=UPI001BD57286|nr:AMP-binding protein [Photorhabdus akhurstii]MBS9430165.1 D-alanine--poly(phosphoribitol) ligase [Photorhabdus akhurstii]
MKVFQHLGEWLYDCALKYADYEALSIENDVYSYRELHELASLLARGFSLSQGKYCALLGRRNIGILAGVVASLCYGKTYLPLNENETPEGLSLLSKITDFDLLVTCAEEQNLLHDLLKHIDKPLVIILSDSKQRPNWCNDYPKHYFLSHADLARMPTAQMKTDNPDAYLMFTSGSTGNPKGVEVAHTNVTRYVSNTIALYQPTCADRFSQICPLSFDVSIHDLFVPWTIGASTHVFDAKNSLMLGGFVRDKHLTFWASVPSVILYFQRLRQLEPGSFPNLRQSLFCGEPLLQNMAKSWHIAAPASHIDNIYGPTEATVAVCGYRWSPESAITNELVVPIGTPYPGTKLKIGRQRQNEGDVEEGELWIGGEQVVSGYLSSNAMQADNFEYDGNCYWYRTGDWVKRDNDGIFHFLGRCDDQLKVNGQRLERLEIESMLSKAVGVDDIAVIGWPVISGNCVEGLVFFISWHEKSNPELRKICQQFMPRSMWPTRLVIGAIPKNRNGKTDYKQLKAKLAEGRVSS